MSELGTLFELLHASRPRWRTIRAAGRQWVHAARNLEAFVRMAAARGRDVAMPASVEGDSVEPEPAEREERWRLWLEPPDRARAEFLVGHGHETVTTVRDGRRAWLWSASDGGQTLEIDEHHSVGFGPGESLIEIAAILPALELEIRGGTSAAGRPAIDVRAIPLAPDPYGTPAGALTGLGEGADEYELLVDAERGVLLRSEARLEGEPFRILEMEEVAYDEEFPPDTFVLDLPKGEVFEEFVETPDVALTELQEKVPFTVLVPEHLPAPAGEPMGHDFGHAMIQPAIPRLGMPLLVYVSYQFGEGRMLTLRETPEALPIRPEQTLEVRGGMLVGEDRSIAPPRTNVRLEQRGTHVELEGVGLSVEELTELAGTLVPLPSGPPPLIESSGARGQPPT